MVEAGTDSKNFIERKIADQKSTTVKPKQHLRTDKACDRLICRVMDFLEKGGLKNE